MLPWAEGLQLGIRQESREQLQECMARERKKEQAYQLLIRNRTERASQKMAASRDIQSQVLAM